MTRAAFEDAAATVLALGGSTNALIHLTAMAGRLGVPFSLADFDVIGRRVPVLADVRPVGAHLMEDFYYAAWTPVPAPAVERGSGNAAPGPHHGGRSFLR